MVAAPIDHICLDERGIAYIAGTSLKVASVAVDAVTWEMTPQQIKENYPQLSLAQIYAALAYYYDHQAEIDAQLAEWDAEYEQLRAANPNPFTREQLQERWQKVIRRRDGGRPRAHPAPSDPRHRPLPNPPGGTHRPAANVLATPKEEP